MTEPEPVVRVPRKVDLPSAPTSERVKTAFGMGSPPAVLTLTMPTLMGLSTTSSSVPSTETETLPLPTLEEPGTASSFLPSALTLKVNVPVNME